MLSSLSAVSILSDVCTTFMFVLDGCVCGAQNDVTEEKWKIAEDTESNVSSENNVRSEKTDVSFIHGCWNTSKRERELFNLSFSC